MITEDHRRIALERAAAEPARQPITVGFLTATVHMGAGGIFWSKIVDAAEKYSINLICFPGGRLRAADDFEAQRNVIYDHIDASRVQGLISWSSTIGGTLAPEDVVRFHQRYRPLPIVSLVQPMRGIPAVATDSYQGMRAAIVHLIEVHGCRRLAFMRGPASHYQAEERYRAYLDVLREYDIPLLPELVTPPMHWEAGLEAIDILLNQHQLQPGVDMQAIVAVSDLLALSALSVLHARGVRVPDDLAIVSFNDSREGRLATPPLTSVALPFYEQGERAIKAVLAQLSGAAVPAHDLLPSHLIVRQSCGCASEAVVQAAIPAGPAVDAPLAVVFDRCRADWLAELARSADAADVSPAIERLLDALLSDLRGATESAFVATLEQTLEQVRRDGRDIAAWQRCISALRRATLPQLSGLVRHRAENCFGQARVLIGEVAQRAQAYQHLQAERQSQILREVGQALITSFDMTTLTEVLAEKLPRLGITSCYLALYEQPAESLEWARLVLAYTEHGRIALDPEGLRFRARQLVPEGLLPQHRRYNMMVEPLYFRETQLGFVLFEIGPRDGALYEELRGYISSALKGAWLFQEAQQARLAAEKADRIKTRLLANVSHELRTPLQIILEHTQTASRTPNPYGVALPPPLLADIQHIQHSAEHQLRLINDLLDLSRAEIDELDLYLELIDPRLLLHETFSSLADQAAASGAVDWRLELPARLPLINADPVRLRQILLNVLSNARKFTEQGHITLGAEVAPPHLHLWVADTGIGIPLSRQERVFEPFITAEHNSHPRMGGIGLGLSITRQLVTLHGGSMLLESRPGEGSTFHIYLPLPGLQHQMTSLPANAQPVLLVISAADPAAEIVAFSERQGLALCRVQAGDNLDQLLAGVTPSALAWDLTNASPRDWLVLRRLRNYPQWSQLPFIVYGQAPSEPGESATTLGLTSFVPKPAQPQTLLDTLSAVQAADATGPILIVDDDPAVRTQHQQIVAQALPGYPIRTACDGDEALRIMAEERPSLVLLDLMMPGMTGADVLDWMRGEPQLRNVPVVILSSKVLSFDDIKQLERHAHVTLQSKGILSEDELAQALNRALFGADALPAHTSALVKRAIAYVQQHHARPFARWELAEAVGVSEDYLSRVFSRELGLTPWDYLNRYRVNHARALLRQPENNIGSIAHQVGFKDQTYFSRVFRKVTGLSPQAYRESLG